LATIALNEENKTENKNLGKNVKKK